MLSIQSSHHPHLLSGQHGLILKQRILLLQNIGIIYRNYKAKINIKLLKEFKKKLSTIVAAGGIVINKENQILFIFRKGKWDLPKGKIEKNEKIDEGAIREVTEETGIKKVKIDRFFV